MCRAPRERSRGRPSRVRRHPARIRGHPARIRGRRERYRGQPWIVPFPGPCHATAGSAAHRPGCGHGPDPGRRRPGSRPGRSTDAHHATGKRPTRPCPAPHLTRSGSGRRHPTSSRHAVRRPTGRQRPTVHRHTAHSLWHVRSPQHVRSPATRSRPRQADRANRPGRPRCSNTGLVTALLHRFGDFFPSTRWGPGSCPDQHPQLCCARVVLPAHGPVDSWTNTFHRLWTTGRSTVRAVRCPPVTHRLWAVVPSDRRLLHTPVHCSARRHPRSLRRVKAVTRSCRTGMWETSAKLGTQLGRTRLGLWVGCAELPVLHRAPELSTTGAHRVRGQNRGADLRKRGYPRYPQGLLLPPTRESAGFVSKWALCTTARREPGCPGRRADRDGPLLSVRYVRLVPGVLPVP